MRSSMQAVAPAPAAHGGGTAGAAADATMMAAPLLHPSSESRRLTRLLVNVTVDRSLWPVHVLLGADSTVADLARAAVATYVREGRRPPLPPGDGNDDAAAVFELHLSKYSLEVLDPEEKMLYLGSRNFFLCARRYTELPGI